MEGLKFKRGGIDYVQPPKGWRRLGMKVKGIFNDDEWVSSDYHKSWPVAYHGFKKFDFTLPKVI